MSDQQKHKLEFIDRVLAEREAQSYVRSLQSIEPLDAVRVIKNGKTLINFSSNDYLGLSKHPTLIQSAQRYMERYGVGSNASRLVTGNYAIYEQLEAQLATACGRETALLFNTGFQANSTVLTVLADRRSLILCDRHIHSSLLQGIIASRSTLIRFRHNDLDHLETLLSQSQKKPYNRILIVSETVFSMDGDRADIDQLIALANQYNALLYLDDAHAIGVLGKNGMGLTAYRRDIDITIGTFGKAFGSFGAFVTCSQKLKDYLINTCPGFIYTTALPPAILGAIAAALELVPNLNAERQFLLQRAEKLRRKLQNSGYDTGASNTQIVSLILGEVDLVIRLTNWLESQGILTIGIRPPTVAVGTARVRLALSSCHSLEHYQQLIQAIETWNR